MMTRPYAAFSILIATCFLLVQAVHADVTRLSDPVAVTADAEIFGAPLDENAKPMSLAALLDSPDEYVDTAVRVEARISQVCQKKGCFFVATDGAATARITFKDYGFFIPTDSGGKQATLYGVFSRQPVSEAEAEHYADDLGESGKVNAEDFSYSIVATGVKIFY